MEDQRRGREERRGEMEEVRRYRGRGRRVITW